MVICYAAHKRFALTVPLTYSDWPAYTRGYYWYLAAGGVGFCINVFLETRMVLLILIASAAMTTSCGLDLDTVSGILGWHDKVRLVLKSHAWFEEDPGKVDQSVRTAVFSHTW